MNKPAAFSIIAVVVFGVAGFGGYQYKTEQDLTEAIDSAAWSLSQQAFWCGLAEEQPKHENAGTNKALCDALTEGIDGKFASAYGAGDKAGIDSREVSQRIQLAFANKMIADNCDTVTVMARGSARCNEAKAIKEAAESVLLAMRS